MPKKPNRYTRIIDEIFKNHFHQGMQEFLFERQEFEDIAEQLQIQLPKNLGDIPYTFRYRSLMPTSITENAPEGLEWAILAAGRSKYRFKLVPLSTIQPSSMLVDTKIPDSTPGVIDKYALTDEQALLAKLRYNRLVDVFSGLTCYSLQNHLRTSVKDIGQAEIDEIYIGIDKRGVHYVLPVQAKGKNDRIGIVQIRQDFAICSVKFKKIPCRSIAAQFMLDGTIALFEFVKENDTIKIAAEKHYKLVKPEELSPEELESYQNRPID